MYFQLQETVREVREIRLYLIMFVFVVCLLGIAASYYLSYTISLAYLAANVVHEESRGWEFIYPFKDKRTDEIGMLGRSFNQC